MNLLFLSIFIILRTLINYIKVIDIISVNITRYSAYRKHPSVLMQVKKRTFAHIAVNLGNPL